MVFLFLQSLQGVSLFRTTVKVLHPRLLLNGGKTYVHRSAGGVWQYVGIDRHLTL